jgi:hypothetical protein
MFQCRFVLPTTQKFTAILFAAGQMPVVALASSQNVVSKNGSLSLA